MIEEIIGVTLASFGVRAVVEMFVESRYKACDYANAPIEYKSLEEWIDKRTKLMEEASAKYPSRYYIKPWERKG